MILQAVELFAVPIDDAKTYSKLEFWRHIPDLNFTPAFGLLSTKIMVESVNKNGFLAKPVNLQVP